MDGCSIVSPAIGKNCLAVGSSMSGEERLSKKGMDEVSDFSSRGPTTDGRIKPDVLAPGHYVSSSYLHVCNAKFGCSSMAFVSC